MAAERREIIHKQIRNLLMVLSLGIGSALALAGFLLYVYGPTGVYSVKNVMVSPSLVGGLTYADQNPSSGKISRYTFEKIEFSYWQADKRQWSKRQISLDSYQRFYEAYAHENSLPIVGEEVIREFQQIPPAKIVVYVRLAGDDPKAALKAFQEVQFANEGDFYRVELHEQDAASSWAYFHHPRIYQEVLALFANKLVEQ